MIGHEDQGSAQDVGAIRCNFPGRRELVVNGERGRRLCCDGSRQQTQNAHAGLEHRRAILDPARMVERGGRRQQDQATVDRRQRRGRQPRPPERRSHRCQVAGGKGCGVTIPKKPRDILKRGRTGKAGSIGAPIIEPVVLDQGEGRLQHRRAEVEGMGGDRLGLASDVAAPFQACDVIGAIAALAAAVDGLRPQQAAAHISVEGGR